MRTARARESPRCVTRDRKERSPIHVRVRRDASSEPYSAQSLGIACGTKLEKDEAMEGSMNLLSRLILGFSFVAPALACTSNVTNQVSSDPCSALAAKCQYCTIPGLAETCNADVSSKDPGSCQDGLDDHDIQTNCVASGGNADSGSPGNPDTGSNRDTGSLSPDTGGHQPDSGPPATCSGGERCAAICPMGSCDSCASTGTCTAVCEGSSCDMTCQGSATCTYECPGGGCTMACLDDSSCALSCSGGGCTFQCATKGTCSTSCFGGGCSGG
jgi:hypothetical protein